MLKAVQWLAGSIKDLSYISPSLTQSYRELAWRSPRNDDRFRLGCNLREM
jgi:hypothetical protein